MTESAAVAPAPRVRPAGAALALLAALAALFFVRAAQEVLVPIVLAGLLFVALDPLVDRLASWRVGRPLGALLVLTGLVAAGAGVLYSLNDDAVAALDELPRVAARLQAQLDRGRGESLGAIDKMKAAAEQIQETASAAIGGAGRSDAVAVRVVEPEIPVARYLVWGSTGLLAFAGQAMLVVLLAFFLLVGGDALKRKLVRAAGTTFSRRRITAQVLDEIGGQVERFLRHLALSSSIVAVATWACLALLGVEHAAFWGVAAGALNTVPYFGAFVASAGIFAAVLVQTGSAAEAAIAAGIALAITLVESAVLQPWLMGRAARTNQIALFVSLLLWSWLWGFWGVLLATPMTMVLKAVADHVHGWSGLAELLGE